MIVTPNVAYLYLHWWYAVTVDGGESWMTSMERFRFIRSVSMKPNGKGVMRVDDGVGDRELETNDYGQTWNAPASSPK